MPHICPAEDTNTLSWTDNNPCLYPVNVLPLYFCPSFVISECLFMCGNFYFNDSTIMETVLPLIHLQIQILRDAFQDCLLSDHYFLIPWLSEGMWPSQRELARQRVERQGRKHPIPIGVWLCCNPLPSISPPWPVLGHARACALCSFKVPGPEFHLQLAMWDVVPSITRLLVNPRENFFFHLIFYPLLLAWLVTSRDQGDKTREEWRYSFQISKENKYIK